jgi:hypothetical protein
VIIMKRQRDLVDRFRDSVATTPDAARRLDELRVRESFIFRRLCAAGVFMCAGDERWWFDAAAWDRYRDRQRQRLVWSAVVIIGLVALGLAIQALW